MSDVHEAPPYVPPIVYRCHCGAFVSGKHHATVSKEPSAWENTYDEAGNFTGKAVTKWADAYRLTWVCKKCGKVYDADAIKVLAIV